MELKQYMTWPYTSIRMNLINNPEGVDEQELLDFYHFTREELLLWIEKGNVKNQRYEMIILSNGKWGIRDK